MTIHTNETPKHRVLRELFRHYLEYRDLVSLPEGEGNSDGVIDYGYYVMDENLVTFLSGKKCEDKDWDEILKRFSEEELLAVGGVEYVPSLKIDLTQRIRVKEDDDGNLIPILDKKGKEIPLYDLKPVVRRAHITISFWDLQGALKALSKRKREAVYYNVIMDQKQKDVADIMGITTVSVGQYVEQAMLQLSEDYFANLEVVYDEALGLRRTG